MKDIAIKFGIGVVAAFFVLTFVLDTVHTVIRWVS